MLALLKKSPQVFFRRAAVFEAALLLAFIGALTVSQAVWSRDPCHLSAHFTCAESVWPKVVEILLDVLTAAHIILSAMCVSSKGLRGALTYVLGLPAAAVLLFLLWGVALMPVAVDVVERVLMHVEQIQR